MSEVRIQKTGEPDILQTSDGRLPLSVPIQIKRRTASRGSDTAIDPPALWDEQRVNGAPPGCRKDKPCHWKYMKRKITMLPAVARRRRKGQD